MCQCRFIHCNKCCHSGEGVDDVVGVGRLCRYGAGDKGKCYLLLICCEPKIALKSKILFVGLVTQPPTLCDRMHCGLPGSSVHAILQARILEWVAIPFSSDLPDLGIEPRFPALQADSLLAEPPEKPKQMLPLPGIEPGP